MTDTKDKSAKDPKWSNSAKVGAAVGSAAVVAALLYAGRQSVTRKRRKREPDSPESTKKVGKKVEKKVGVKKRSKAGTD